jgi:hypothetical protein
VPLICRVKQFCCKSSLFGFRHLRCLVGGLLNQTSLFFFIRIASTSKASVSPRIKLSADFDNSGIELGRNIPIFSNGVCLNWN